MGAIKMRNAIMIVAALSVGCGVVRVNEHTTTAEEVAQANRAERKAKRAAQKEKDERDFADGRARYASEIEAHKAAREKAESDKAKAHADDCASDRATRMTTLGEIHEAIEKRQVVIDWINGHCKWIDNGQDVVKTYMGPDGTLTQRMGRTGYVKRVCPRGAPVKELPPDRNEWDGVPTQEDKDQRRNRECRADDETAGVPQPCAYQGGCR